jgi:hypothetical protein
MSANNQVIIRKVTENKFEGYDVDIDSYIDHNGDVSKATWNNRQPIFVTTTLEEAIQQYYAYCAELARIGLYVEYGLGFEGV